ncbi:hypothetical protein SPV1_01592 [Mariprofundus ferrooxydans PV-1]|uniref:Lipoprotein n=2 Tax=Mariprofundus ferrooxydans TaxID=314344 RepID=Q0F2F0_9PROT|nr:hypothetical protein SPV1_01592 [Mariprofundus ferrooxydans PV-1]
MIGVSLKKDVMKKLTSILIAAVLMLIAGCSYQDMADNLIPKQESAFAKDYLHRLQTRDFESIKKYIDPSIEAQVTDNKLLEAAKYFPSGNLLSTELIGSQVNVVNGNWQGNFSFEYHFSDGWALANVVLKKSDDNLSVIGFNVYRTKASQKELNKFTLGGKSALHYFVLALAVLAPLFILVTTYFCIRTPIPKRKWLWVVFVLVGIGSISINWSTGQFGIQPLSIKLFSASAFEAGPFAPWIISASIPLGAIIFWFKRKRFIATNRANIQVNEDASR